VAEIDLHKAVAQYLDWCLMPPAFYSCFPSGWDRMSKARAGMLRGCGLKAGMPDIMAFYAGQTICFELKRPRSKGVTRGRLSNDQITTIDKLCNAGIPVYVCSDVLEIEAKLRLLGWPLRGTMRAA
jgi:hypothetical protein